MIDSDTQPAAEEAEKKPPHPWAELAPEHFRLLRLAPLPTDRATGARPCASSNSAGSNGTARTRACCA